MVCLSEITRRPWPTWRGGGAVWPLGRKIINEMLYRTVSFQTHLIFTGGSWDSSVGIAIRHGQDGRGVEIRWGAKISVPIQQVSESERASCSKGTKSLTRG